MLSPIPSRPERATTFCSFRVILGISLLFSGACYVIFIANMATAYEPPDGSFAEQRFPEQSEQTEQSESMEDGQKPIHVSAKVWKTPRLKGGSILDRRQKLLRWLQSSATIQEIETLSHLKQWVIETQPEEMARELARHTKTGWSRCAREHELCVCKSPEIRFGYATLWVPYQRPEFSPPTADLAVLCEVRNFGGRDPAAGYLKECQCYSQDLPIEGAVGTTAGLPVNSQYCGEACSKGKNRAYTGSPRSRAELCRRPHTHELLWTCNQPLRRVPRSPGHQQAEHVLTAATMEFCGDSRLAKYFDVYLDCDYAENFLKWTSEESDWIEEAFVTYVGGEMNSNYEWMATNLLRSTSLFSTRPIIVMVTDSKYRPPSWWARTPNVIVYKMASGLTFPVSFNFNKIRSMIAARVIVGIQLDVDQLVAPGIDNVFRATRIQCTQKYPFPLMPVHWMSRDAELGEQFYEYRLQFWNRPHGMRWCHAHPTWTYWALLFLGNLLLKRYLVALAPDFVASVRTWGLSNLVPIDVVEMLKAGTQAQRVTKVKLKNWMMEDEDMLNVELWMANATKAWCKFDLEPDTYLTRFWITKKIYADPRWYPDGVPLMFFSVHNTKRFDRTDKLLTIFARCTDPNFVNQSSCSTSLTALPTPCQMESLKEEEERLQRPEEYAADICCCLQPRQEQHIYWAGNWYSSKEQVPLRSPLESHAPRRCILI